MMKSETTAATLESINAFQTAISATITGKKDTKKNWDTEIRAFYNHLFAKGVKQTISTLNRLNALYASLESSLLLSRAKFENLARYYDFCQTVLKFINTIALPNKEIYTTLSKKLNYLGYACRYILSNKDTKKGLITHSADHVILSSSENTVSLAGTPVMLKNSKKDWVLRQYGLIEDTEYTPENEQALRIATIQLLYDIPLQQQNGQVSAPSVATQFHFSKDTYEECSYALPPVKANASYYIPSNEANISLQGKHYLITYKPVSEDEYNIQKEINLILQYLYETDMFHVLSDTLNSYLDQEEFSAKDTLSRAYRLAGDVAAQSAYQIFSNESKYEKCCKALSGYIETLLRKYSSENKTLEFTRLSALKDLLNKVETTAGESITVISAGYTQGVLQPVMDDPFVLGPNFIVAEETDEQGEASYWEKIQYGNPLEVEKTASTEPYSLVKMPALFKIHVTRGSANSIITLKKGCLPGIKVPKYFSFANEFCHYIPPRETIGTDLENDVTELNCELHFTSTPEEVKAAPARPSSIIKRNKMQTQKPEALLAALKGHFSNTLENDIKLLSKKTSEIHDDFIQTINDSAIILQTFEEYVVFCKEFSAYITSLIPGLQRLATCQYDKHDFEEQIKKFTLLAEKLNAVIQADDGNVTLLLTRDSINALVNLKSAAGFWNKTEKSSKKGSKTIISMTRYIPEEIPTEEECIYAISAYPAYTVYTNPKGQTIENSVKADIHIKYLITRHPVLINNKQFAYPNFSFMLTSSLRILTDITCTLGSLEQPIAAEAATTEQPKEVSAFKERETQDEQKPITASKKETAKVVVDPKAAEAAERVKNELLVAEEKAEKLRDLTRRKEAERIQKQQEVQEKIKAAKRKAALEAKAQQLKEEAEARNATLEEQARRDAERDAIQPDLQKSALTHAEALATAKAKKVNAEKNRRQRDRNKLKNFNKRNAAAAAAKAETEKEKTSVASSQPQVQTNATATVSVPVRPPRKHTHPVPDITSPDAFPELLQSKDSESPAAADLNKTSELSATTPEFIPNASADASATDSHSDIISDGSDSTDKTPSNLGETVELNKSTLTPQQVAMPQQGVALVPVPVLLAPRYHNPAMLRYIPGAAAQPAQQPPLSTYGAGMFSAPPTQSPHPLVVEGGVVKVNGVENPTLTAQLKK